MKRDYNLDKLKDYENDGAEEENKQDEESIIRDFCEEFKFYADARRPKEDRWKRWLDLYYSQSAKRPTGTANIFVPATFTIVETLVPHLANAYINNKKPVELYGRSPEDHQFAEQNKQILEYQLNQQLFILEYVLTLRQAIQLGTAIAFTSQRFDEDYDMPYHEMVDLFDFWPDPYARDIDDCRSVFTRKMVSLEELKAKGYKTQGLENDLILSGLNNTENIQTSGINIENQNPYGPDGQSSEDNLSKNKYKKDVELLIRWTDKDYTIVANQKFLMKQAENPFLHKKKPFTRYVLIPQSNSFYGIGLIEPIESLQNELNTKRNQRLDEVNLSIHQMWMVKPDALKDTNQLKMRPGGIIEVDADRPMSDVIQPVPVNNFTGNALQEEGICKSDIQNTSGIDDNIQGKYDVGKQVTATEFRAKMGQATNRIDFYFKLMAQTGLKRQITLHIQLNNQFIQTPQVIRIIGNEGVKWPVIMPQEISNNFDIEIDVDPSGYNKESQLNKYMGALQVIMQFAQFAMAQGIQVNPEPVIRKILEKFDIEEEIVNKALPQPQSSPCSPYAPTENPFEQSGGFSDFPPELMNIMEQEGGNIQ